MPTESSSLRELHRIHLALQEVRDQLTDGPRQIEQRKRIVDRKKEELEKQKAELKQLKMAADAKSLQLRTNESKISELKVKLNAASSNKEFDIIKSQIDADSMANSVLEDEILESLEKADRKEQSIRSMDEELAAAVAEHRRVAEKVESAIPGLQSQVKTLETALKDAERHLPGSVLDNYRRLVNAHGAGALAAVEKDACNACHEILSPNSRVEVRAGKLHFCRSCGRLLYHPAGE